MTTAEEGQVTRAAARLHIAQPALSQTLAKLESTLGLRLLERHARGVELTPAGAAFFEKAKVAVAAAHEASTVLGPWLRADRALVLGFTPSLSSVARPIVRRYAELRPEVDLRIQHLGASGMATELTSGAHDVHMVLARPDEACLASEPLFRAPRFVLLSEHHRLAGEQQLLFEQLEGETFPNRHPMVSDQWAKEAWLSNYRGSDPPLTPETPTTLEEVWALIYANRAIAILPDFMVELAAGDGVRAIPLADVPGLEVSLCWRADDERDSVRALVEMVLALRDAGELHRPQGGVENESLSGASGRRHPAVRVSRPPRRARSGSG